MQQTGKAMGLRERRTFLSSIGSVLALTGWQSTFGATAQPIGSPFVTARDGCRIAYRDFGPRTTPPIFFCTMGNAAMPVWMPVANPPSSEHRVVLHDRRGNGESEPGAPGSHTFSQYRDDAIAVLDELGVKQATVCGMAFGARVALRPARDSPDRVSKLILFDATGGPAAPEAVRRAGAEEAARLRATEALPNAPSSEAGNSELIKELQDAGVDEILAKPLSTTALWLRIKAVIDKRRRFVRVEGFFGPDRRRRAPGIQPGVERRKRFSN